MTLPPPFDKIFSEIKADYNNYASEEAVQYDNDKVIINDCIRKDIEAEASEYGIKIMSVECDTEMVEEQIVIRKIIFRIKCEIACKILLFPSIFNLEVIILIFYHCSTSTYNRHHW